jgi:ribosomal protein S18 acetylase RimI-like enzyme
VKGSKLINSSECGILKNKEMIIRKANTTDADVIIEFQKAMALETENLILDSETLLKGVMAVFEDKGKGQYFVAEDNAKVVASLMITFEWSDWRNAIVWWFQSVYVIPEFRRQGIFRMMYDFIKNEGLKENIAGMRLYVESENHRAQKTYEALGMNGSHYKTYEWLRS